ncbi:4-coumarate--CoA ligase-like 7 [Ixodes scapularis]
MALNSRGVPCAQVDGVTGAATTFSELWQQTMAFAAAFRHRGLTPGQKVCFHGSNHVTLWPAFLGIASIQGVLVMAKASLTVRELLYQLEDSQPTFIVTEAGLLDKVLEVREAAGSIQDIFLFSDSEDYVTLDSLLEEGLALGPDMPPLARSDPRSTPLTVLYSSGTTGLPKGVVSTHFNFVSQMVQMGTEGENMCNYTDVIVLWLPSTHLSGVFFCLVALAQGATALLFPGFKLDLLLAGIQRYQATLFPLLPTYAAAVSQSPLVSQFNVSSVRTIGIGGNATPEVVAQELARIFNIESLIHVYGMTESSGMVTMTSTHGRDIKSVGYPLPLTEIRVLDLDTDKPLGIDRDGEILVRGPQIMLHYLNKPEATRNAVDPDGWYHTGDLGHFDGDGKVYIVDRVKDLIKCMDQQVAPAELEDLLMTHPLVVQVAVAGVPHNPYGEAARAFVVLSEEAAHVPLERIVQELETLVAETSAPHKHLHGGVQFLSELPKSESGKYLRRELRDFYLRSIS